MMIDCSTANIYILIFHFPLMKMVFGSIFLLPIQR